MLNLIKTEYYIFGMHVVIVIKQSMNNGHCHPPRSSLPRRTTPGSVHCSGFSSTDKTYLRQTKEMKKPVIRSTRCFSPTINARISDLKILTE
jgi:hypothetical protein